MNSHTHTHTHRATMAQEAAGKLEEKVSELEGLIAQGQLQLQSKSDEVQCVCVCARARLISRGQLELE